MPTCDWHFGASKSRQAFHSLEFLEVIASEKACRIGAIILPEAEEGSSRGLLLEHYGVPTLPDHLRGDEDGPTCSDEEKKPKRIRSTSTTPRSLRCTDPDDYDQVMGVSSVGHHEPARFGEGSATDVEENQEGVAKNSHDMEEAREGTNTYATTQQISENDFGAGSDSWGYSRATLLECLNRLGEQSNPVATCASGETNGGSLPHTDPRQVMSPNTSQTLPQDPFRMQESPQVNTNLRSETPLHQAQGGRDANLGAPKGRIRRQGGAGVSWCRRGSDLTTKSTFSSTTEATSAYYQDTRTGPSEAP